MRLHLSAGFVAAALCAPAARAEEGATSTATISVLVETDGHPTRLDDDLCIRGSCVARISPGLHRLTRLHVKDGQLVDEQSFDVTIGEPSVLRVAGPGALRTGAWVATGAGATLTLTGLLVPLFVCRSSTTLDPVTGHFTSANPCDRVSDGVKVAWIGGTGVGITLALVGAIGLALTDPTLRASVEPWRAPRLSMQPIVMPRGIADAPASVWGIELRGSF